MTAWRYFILATILLQSHIQLQVCSLSVPSSLSAQKFLSSCWKFKGVGDQVARASPRSLYLSNQKRGLVTRWMSDSAAITSLQQPSFKQKVEEIVPEENKIMHLLLNFDAKKSLYWAFFFALLWIARPFYGLFLGTFFFTYLGNSAVDVGMRAANRVLGVIDETNARLNALGRDPLLPLRGLPRKTYAAVYLTLFVTILTTATVFLVPNMRLESQYFTRIIQRESPYVVVTEALVNALGSEPVSRLEAFLVSVAGSEGRAYAGLTDDAAQRLLRDVGPGAKWTQERSSYFAKLLQYNFRGQLYSSLIFVRRLLQGSTSFLANGLVSFLFSSMIIYDYPNLSSKFSQLKENKRLAYPFKIFAPKFKAFATLVGQSFEVQTLIALCNTILTTLGLLVLRIPGAVLMSILVFVCSFIPLAGIIISTFPMCAVALTEYGLGKVGQVIAMVVIVHAVEAYLLNPQIYASKLKLHPLFVLASLYITEHFTGVQGLFLAVPVAVYIYNEIILDQSSKAQ